MTASTSTNPRTSPLDATNLVVVRGELSSAPRRRELASGDVLVEFDVTTRGDGGVASAPVAWFNPGPAADGLTPDRAVLVVGRVRRRFFRASGSTQSRTEVIALRVVDGTRPRAVTRALAEVAVALAPGRASGP